MFIALPNGPDGGIRAHAVNAFNCRRIHGEEYALDVYDSNFPGRTLSMTVRIEGSRVSYSYVPMKDLTDYRCTTGMGMAFANEDWERYR